MVVANNFFCLLMFLHFRILISEKQSFLKKKKLPFRIQKESQVDFTSWGAWKPLNKPTQVSVSVDIKILENNYYFKISG